MKKLILLIVLFIVCASDVSGYCSQSNMDLINKVNNQRVANGLEILQPNDRLLESAKMKSTDMYQNHYFAHEGWVVFVIASGYTGHRAGENLAKDFDCNNDIVNAWMGSPGHRVNILGDYDYIGAYRVGDYITVHFGKN